MTSVKPLTDSGTADCSTNYQDTAESNASTSFKVSRKSLEQIYISFTRPLLEYCHSVWNNSSTEAKKQVEAIHIEAAKTIVDATKLCSINILFDDLSWESLQSRRKKSEANHFL